MEKRLTLFLTCLLMSLRVAFAQVDVSGTVISQDDGEPVIGASVVIFGGGNSTGTVTDIDGKFKLNVPSGSKLQISYVGMQTQILPATANMKVSLKPEAQLQEVVVTGLQRTDRRLFTGATDKVNAADAKLDGVADISRSLEGRAAGVSVQNVSGTFGTAPKIRVRGATSIYGSSKPLWVVDGVIMEDVSDVNADDLSSGDPETLISSAIAGLNSDDIESFQILKDGSATSIYGARAMAGVIVVTTKKGKQGQAHVNYTGEFTTRLIPSYSDFDILNSQDQMAIYKEMEKKGWLNLSTVLNSSNYGVYGKMYELITTYDKTSGMFGIQNTEEAKNAYLQQAEFRNTNWFSELFSANIMQNHSISLSGGTSKSNYYASMSAMLDPGWYVDSKVNRYTFNANVTHHILDNLSVNVIGGASYRKQKAPGTLGQDVDVVSGQVKRDFDINPYSYALNTSRALDPNEYYRANYAPFNIKHELATNFIDLNVIDAKFQAEFKWKPIKSLELSLLGALKYSATTQEHKIMDSSNQAEAYRAMGTTQIRDDNKYLYTDPDNVYSLPITILPQGGIYQRTTIFNNGYGFSEVNENLIDAQQLVWTPEYAKWPYLYNIANFSAKAYYEDHGLEQPSPAFEIGKEEPTAWSATDEASFVAGREHDKVAREHPHFMTNAQGESLIMQCRHCIRYSLGYCVKRGGQRPTWKEPLYLRLGDGKRFRLEFACNECQMNVYSV